MAGRGGVGGQSHEIYVWDADELLHEVTKAKVATRTAVEANETLKKTIDADVVALTQLVQSGGKVAQQIKLLGLLGRAYIKDVNGRKYVIFKGNAKLRPNLRGTRYLAENAKVRCFVIGSKDILKDVAKGTKIAVIAFIVIDIVAELSSDQPSLASLGVHIGSDVLQAVVASAVGYAAGVAIIALAPAAPVVLVFIAVVAIGFTVGMVLTDVDRRFRLTDRAVARMRAYESEFERRWPVIKQSAFEAEHRAAQLATDAGNKVYTLEQRSEHAARRIGNSIVVEAYKVDRYFYSLADMVETDAGRYLGR